MIIETIYEWKSSQKTQSFHRDSTPGTPEYKVTQYATEELSKELLEQDLYFSKKVVNHIPNRCSDRMKEFMAGVTKEWLSSAADLSLAYRVVGQLLWTVQRK